MVMGEMMDMRTMRGIERGTVVCTRIITQSGSIHM